MDLGRCRLLVRLRMKRVGQGMSLLFKAFGGLVDYVTIALMAAGLRERLWGEQACPSHSTPAARARPGDAAGPNGESSADRSVTPL